MLENDKMRVKQLRRFDAETTQKNRQGELINISSTLKVESTSKFPRRINVIISICIRLLKSIKSQRTFHVEFRWRINKDVSIGITPVSISMCLFSMFLTNDIVATEKLNGIYLLTFVVDNFFAN